MHLFILMEGRKQTKTKSYKNIFICRKIRFERGCDSQIKAYSYLKYPIYIINVLFMQETFRDKS